jgi:hypothetical protein
MPDGLTLDLASVRACQSRIYGGVDFRAPTLAAIAPAQSLPVRLMGTARIEPFIRPLRPRNALFPRGNHSGNTFLVALLDCHGFTPCIPALHP